MLLRRVKTYNAEHVNIVLSLLQLATDQCSKQGCISNINCCLTSSPCHNRGRCVPSGSGKARRFTCQCPDGYEGERCERKTCKPGYIGPDCNTRITSCLGYKDITTKNFGKYTLIDGTGNPYQVMCEFIKHNGFIWTLVQSYSLANKDKFNESFAVNDPINEDNLDSMDRYRLSKVRIDLILSSSTRWRITCKNASRSTGNVREIVRARLNQVPVFSNHTWEKCVKVEYINIRGHKCGNCRAFMVNDGVRPFYFDPKRSGEVCDFTVPDITMCGNEGENSFGYYNCINPSHRCSASNHSTTFMWLGGR